jgi:MOSC domain-containing protein
VTITGLYVHPIKSCAGIAVSEARVTMRGLEHDRRWMVVDEEGRFVTQRTLPEMALVGVALTADGGLTVTRAGLPPLTLPGLHADGARLDVEVWRDRVAAVRHDDGSAWFSRALGRPLQLVCMPDDTRRPVDAAFARAGDVVSFADGFPLLVVNRASVEALATDVRRFRPNVVVDGATPWAEDEWRGLAVGALMLRTPKPCARCAIPGIDPDSAAITKEPLRTLAQLRTRDHQVWFGINAIPDSEGRLRVGDAVRALL